MGIFSKFRKKEEEVDDFSNQNIDYEHFDFNSNNFNNNQQMQQNPMQDPLSGTSLSNNNMQQSQQNQFMSNEINQNEVSNLNQVSDDMNFDKNFNFQTPNEENVQQNTQDEYYEFDAYEELKKQLDLITSKLDTLLYAIDGIDHRIKILEANSQNKKIF